MDWQFRNKIDQSGSRNFSFPIDKVENSVRLAHRRRALWHFGIYKEQMCVAVHYAKLK
jgi:hypothetical protein